MTTNFKGKEFFLLTVEAFMPKYKQKKTSTCIFQELEQKIREKGTGQPNLIVDGLVNVKPTAIGAVT